MNLLRHNELGITQRMVSYDEGYTEGLPSSLLPALCKALEVTCDELLGLNRSRKKPDTRLQQIEKMETKDKRQVMQLLDTFIENMRLKKQVKT